MCRPEGTMFMWPSPSPDAGSSIHVGRLACSETRRTRNDRGLARSRRTSPTGTRSRPSTLRSTQRSSRIRRRRFRWMTSMARWIFAPASPISLSTRCATSRRSRSRWLRSAAIRARGEPPPRPRNRATSLRRRPLLQAHRRDLARVGVRDVSTEPLLQDRDTGHAPRTTSGTSVAHTDGTSTAFPTATISTASRRSPSTASNRIGAHRSPSGTTDVRGAPPHIDTALAICACSARPVRYEALISSTVRTFERNCRPP